MINYNTKNSRIKLIVCWDLPNSIHRKYYGIHTYFDLYTNTQSKVADLIFPIKDTLKSDLHGR